MAECTLRTAFVQRGSMNSGGLYSSIQLNHCKSGCRSRGDQAASLRERRFSSQQAALCTAILWTVVVSSVVIIRHLNGGRICRRHSLTTPSRFLHGPQARTAPNVCPNQVTTIIRDS
ncbi:hypothetical protein IE81DRAFT_11704 [Ceraceosorus guamensis]|uniref:Uncharacterized protein n=1 Tax=Ceraceosorus guamensis TaxID=1522189 RepID=A0A316W783_9BASI|nr:hypothetical protein IE81DRAFT_11704 [Ceraceosorus guamensis]PWN44591.1 hypothetical protein IE81DRAFT_11704 [Ceraceosorus guamensis]